MNKKIKVIILDDELRAINRLKILLRNFVYIDVTGQFTRANEALKFVETNPSDIIFMDIEMPDKSGLEISEEIKKYGLNIKIIFITGFNHYAIDAIKHNNVFDYLLKPISIDILKKTLERFQSEILINFSIKELEIIRLISRGFNSKEIGAKINLSKHTIDTYRRSILEKSSCKNTAELILYSSKLNII